MEIANIVAACVLGGFICSISSGLLSSFIFSVEPKVTPHEDAKEPRNGVQCTSLQETDAFYVEIKLSKNRTLEIIEIVGLIIRAIAGAWEYRCHRDVNIEIAPCSLNSRGKEVLMMSIIMKSNTPASCTGIWIGNIISKILDSELCSKSLINIDVQPLKVRAVVVQRQILSCQEHWDRESLGTAPTEPCEKGKAAIWRWEPRSASMCIDIVEADDDDAETPVRVLGIASVREEKKKAKENEKTTDQNAQTVSDKTNDLAKDLENVIASP